MGRPPTIAVRIPAFARTGRPLAITVDVACAEETVGAVVEVRLEGVETASTWSHAHVALVERFTPATLPQGTTSFRADFAIPPDAPPSYEGVSATVRYTLSASLTLPRETGDAVHETFVVHAASTPRAAPRPVAAKGPIFQHLELALDDEVAAPGDVIHGQIAVSRWGPPSLQENARIEAVRVVGLERASPPWGGSSNVERVGLDADLSATELSGGRPIGFSCRLPEDAPPTYFTARSALSWWVLVRATVTTSYGLVPDTLCEVPLLVIPLEGPPQGGAAPMRLGSDRHRHVWANAGAPYGLSLDEDALRLMGRIAGTTVAIGWVNDLLCAEIRYDDLGLGLELNGILADGRDKDQIRAAFDPALGRALQAFSQAEMDDVRAIVREHRRYDEEDFVAVVGDVAKLAGWIGVLRHRVQPPAALTAALSGYRALAAALSGKLTVGNMTIRDGAVDGLPVDVITLFDGPVPKQTGIMLRLATPVAAPMDARDPALTAGLPDEARRMWRSLADDAASVNAVGDALFLVLPEAERDADRLRIRVRDLSRFVRLLRDRSGHGPYR